MPDPNAPPPPRKTPINRFGTTEQRRVTAILRHLGWTAKRGASDGGSLAPTPRRAEVYDSNDAMTALSANFILSLPARACAYREKKIIYL